MRSENTSRSDARFFLALGLALAAAVVVGVMLAGCATTITPPVAAPASDSWDGTNQNSGFISFTRSGNGAVTGAVITPHARDRYNVLMREYGNAWGILAPDSGIVAIPGNSYWIDAQHLGYFADAQRWKRNGRAPDK